MPTKSYTKPTSKNSKSAGTSKGRSQAKGTATGQQHTDFQVAYGKSEKDVDLFKQQFRVRAYVGEKFYDVGPMLTQLQWQESTSDQFTAANTAAPLTGSLQLTKPAVSQYGKLLDPFFSATLDKHGVSRWGALGIGIRCDVGFDKAFTPLWAMRVTPTADSSDAEQITLQDGTWTLALADDLALANETVDDFLFTKGKKTHSQGWRAHEVAIAVCKQMSIPIKQLVRGTAYFSMSAKDTQAIGPITLIANAYQEETNRTGKTFVVRWATPDKKFPMGALEVVTLRRNPSLLRFRKQLIDAALTRSQNPDFATVLLGRATLKGGHGKNRQLTYLAQNTAAIKRFGWVHKIVDFKPVSSQLELEIMAKRALAMRLTPLRTAELTHPGVATVRRGDAIRIDLPEEGYAQKKANAYSTPRSPTARSGKYTAVALQAGEALDPSLFGLPDPSTLSATGAAGSTANALTSDTPVIVPVADQGIAFVVSAQHTVTSGSYTMDLQTQFVDVLDPVTVKAQVEATIRAAKSSARSGSKSSSSSGSAASAGGWVRVGATLDPTRGQYPTYDDHGGFSFAELLQAGANMGLHPSLTEVLNAPNSSRGASGRPEMAMETAILVMLPGGNKQFTIYKNDVGSGQAGNPHYKVDLHQGIATALGWSPNGDIMVKLA